MAMPAYEPPDYPQVTLPELADQLPVPGGYRTEIIEGSIVVSPTPIGPHALAMFELHDALRPCLPAGYADVEMTSVELAETEQRYIPDVVVISKDVLRQDRWLFSSSSALMVVEVTSPSTVHADRVWKRHGYASSAVPVYLLVDRDKRVVNLYTEPSDGEYQRRLRVSFGEKVELPEPFTGAIDTAAFS